jgi:phage terminase large subunit
LPTQVLEIPTARVFAPLIAPKRYKAAWGGRGSGKSHFFAGLMVERAFAEPGFRGVCVREVQKDLRQSAKKLVEDKIADMGLGSAFDCQVAEIKTPGGGTIIFQGMQDHTAESIKSLEGFDVAWVEEAQSLSARSLTLLRPTLRKEGSELWFSWNPRRKTDPVDDFFRGESRTQRANVVRANYTDNPWFPQELEDERREDLELRPDQYEHIWEGGYAQVTEGAYFARDLAAARKEGRITTLAADPLMQLRCFWDLGQADATAIWVAQFNGRKIDVLDYMEGQRQPLAYYVNWLRERGHGNALCVLPHDGAHPDTVMGIKFEDHLRSAGFNVQTVKNQGRGAAMQRVEAARRLFPRIWFNADTTTAGLEALGAYHERIDEKRQIGLGPEHDWASHGADAFGLMCVAYEEPLDAKKPKPRAMVGAGGWLG